MSPITEQLTQTIVIVSVSLAISFSAVGFACTSAWDCVGKQDCKRVSLESSRYLPQCSFQRVPTLMEALEYVDMTGQDNSTKQLDAQLRVYCAPGERLQLFADDDAAPSSSQSKQESCTPQYSYPNSINDEITDPAESSYSRKMCGAWMDAGAVSNPYGANYWSFSGIENEIDAVQDASLASVSSSLSRTNIGKINEKCHHTVLAGDAAILASSKDAYRYLLQDSKLHEVSDADSALASLGNLIGHYCDGPVSIGWTYANSHAIQAFSATMYAGSRFSDTAVGEAMQMVGEDKTSTEASVAANKRLNEAAQNVLAYPTLVTLERVYEGASGRLDHENVSLVYGYADELVAFKAVADEDVDAAKAFLKGVAATCSFVVSNSLNYVGFTALPSWSAAHADLKRRREDKVEITSLGRMRPKQSRGKKHPFEPMMEMDNATMHNATSATFSQLVGSTFEDADSQCKHYATTLFPDTLDAEQFSIIYSQRLYNRLRETTERARAGVVQTLKTNPEVRKVLSDPDRVASDVESVRVRIPGAPRGTWAGANRNLPYAFFDASDSFFKMALKQARAVFLDRQDKLVYEATDVCEGPPAMASLTPNAYIYPSIGCSYYLLGLSLRPFMDETFDEESLLSRAGYVIAHEMSHSTMNVDWNTDELRTLLSRYEPNTYSEAIADVVAGLGLLRSNNNFTFQLSTQKLCEHVAQTWCARTGALYYTASVGEHPRANERGNFFCQTLIEDLAM